MKHLVVFSFFVIGITLVHAASQASGFEYLLSAMGQQGFRLRGEHPIYSQDRYIGTDLTTEGSGEDEVKPLDTLREQERAQRVKAVEDFECSGLADGSYQMCFEHGSCCEFYASCTGGELEVKTCHAGTRFDQETGNCIDPDTFGGECGYRQNCTGWDGYFADKINGCWHYYHCDKGQFIGRKECPHDTMFDVRIDTCLPLMYDPINSCVRPEWVDIYNRLYVATNTVLDDDDFKSGLSLAYTVLHNPEKTLRLVTLVSQLHHANSTLGIIEKTPLLNAPYRH